VGVDPPPCLRGIFSWCPVTLGWEGREGGRGSRMEGEREGGRRSPRGREEEREQR